VRTGDGSVYDIPGAKSGENENNAGTQGFYKTVKGLLCENYFVFSGLIHVLPPVFISLLIINSCRTGAVKSP
jgi:hypothetical protein